MRLRHIEVFYAVYRTGSVTGAAQELNVSQPSVSKVLRHAEDQLGYPLFRRNKGRLEPTEAAHELFGEVDEVYRQVRSLRQTAKNIGARRGGHIRLGLLPSLGFGVIPEAIARLRAPREHTQAPTPPLAAADRCDRPRDCQQHREPNRCGRPSSY